MKLFKYTSYKNMTKNQVAFFFGVMLVLYCHSIYQGYVDLETKQFLRAELQQCELKNRELGAFLTE